MKITIQRGTNKTMTTGKKVRNKMFVWVYDCTADGEKEQRGEKEQKRRVEKFVQMSQRHSWDKRMKRGSEDRKTSSGGCKMFSSDKMDQAA